MNQAKMDRLVQEALEIAREDAQEVGALGFMARAMAMATMPHSETPGQCFERRNGAFSLSMVAGPKTGLPYGSLPRLLIAWLTTEIVKTKKRKLMLGPSLAAFMDDLGVTPVSGRWGTKTRLRDQMKRLFGCSIYSGWGTKKIEVMHHINVMDSYELWWDPQVETQQTLWRSNITLSRHFYEELRKYPVPIDLRVLAALRKSPLAIDIYTWLTHRVSYLAEKTRVSWLGLQTQFGTGYNFDPQGQRDFRRAFRNELKCVTTFYTEADIDELGNHLIVKPCKTHIVSMHRIPKKAVPCGKPGDNPVEN
jgi:hypothetical protein